MTDKDTFRQAMSDVSPLQRKTKVSRHDPNRHQKDSILARRSAAEADFEKNIPNGNLSDAIFPFVRQFANHDRKWFDKQNWPNVHQWLAVNLASEEFSICMTKYSQWQSA